MNFYGTSEIFTDEATKEPRVWNIEGDGLV